MAVPTLITDLSATASNNSPAGTEAVLPNLDNYLRAHAAFIRQTYDDTLSKTSGGTVSGATTFSGNLTLSNSVSATGPVTLSGTNTISGATTFSGTVTLGASATATTPGLTSNSARVATTAFVRDILPSGVIVMWSGSVASIPSGWLLCDGSNGTPDLRNRFIVGAGSTYAVAATGGSADAVLVSHTHTATVSDPGHVHTFTARGDDGTLNGAGTGVVGYDVNVGAGTGGMASATTGVTVTNSTEGVSATNANLPPYYALCFIQKS